MKPLLTIGMIVKNEEKTLRRCLDSIRQLLRLPEFELIITDTGSTDKTVEIAREYTENILHFEWIDDFGAARNQGLLAAKGSWFMQLDADEYLEEDPEEIEFFFLSGEYIRYNAASIKFKDFQDSQGEVYKEYALNRLFKIDANNRYHGKIHEAVKICLPIKALNTKIYHTGYVFESKTELRAKYRRNISAIIKKFKENPNDEVTTYNLAQQYISYENYEEALLYIRHGLNKETMGDSPMYPIFLAMKARCLYFLEKYKDAEEVALYYRRKIKKKNPQSMDILNILGGVSMKAGDFIGAISYFEEYLGLYKYFAEAEAKEAVIDIVGATSFNIKGKNKILTNRIICLIELEKIEEAFAEIKEIFVSIWTSSEPKLIVTCIGKFLGKRRGINFINDIFLLSQDSGAVESLTIIFIKIINEIYETPQNSENLLNYFKINMDEMETLAEEKAWKSYCLLMKIRLMEEEGLDAESLKVALRSFEGTTEEVVFSQIISFFIRYNMDFMKLCNGWTIEQIELAVKEAFKKEDLGKYIAELVSNLGKNEIKKKLTAKEVYTYVVLVGEAAVEKKLGKQEGEILLNTYVELCIDYASAVYQEGALNGETMFALPTWIRFALTMKKAKLEEEKKEWKEALRLYIEAMKLKPEFAETIKSLAERTTSKLNKDLQGSDNSKIAEEMRVLAIAVKGKIKELIGLGMVEPAKILIDQYRAIAPNDEELENLEIELLK